MLPGQRVVRRSLVLAVAGLLATVLVAAVPSLQLAYRSPDGHLVLETLVATITPLVLLLVYGRFRRSRRLRELLLGHALGVLAVASLGFVVVPLVLGAPETSALTTWAPLTVRVVSAALFLAAALVPEERTVAPGLPVRQVLGVGALLLLVGVGAHLLDAVLPTAVAAQPSPESSGRPSLTDHPVVLAVQAVNVACFTTAAVAFTLQARRTGDDFIGWVAAAAVLGAWARVNYLLFPSLYTEWLYTGDVLRLGFYLLLLLGGLLEVRDYWRAKAEVAVFSERRRLARDLHDGAVQELGYIMSVTSAGRADPSTAQVRSAAERALAEARRAVSALAAPAHEPLEDAVGREVGELGDRYDVPVVVDCEAQVTPVGPDQREQLVRIAREAVANAARHGRPAVIRVTLRPGELVVEDDGAGFSPAHVPRGRYGLVSMRERATGMDARFEVDSAPGRGTRVQVGW